MIWGWSTRYSDAGHGVCLWGDSVYATYAPGQLFGLVNSFVHTIMYFYYFLTAATGRRYAWGALVTQIQIAQMFVGLGLALLWAYYQFLSAGQCGLYRSNPTIAVVASSLLYGTYLILFLKLHFTRNVAPRQAKTRTAAGAPHTKNKGE